MPMALGLGLGLPYIAAASGPYPALDLNFVAMAASGTLDSRVTYTGASLATLTDATGAIAYKPHNLFVRSEELNSASWTKFNSPTVTANTAVAPDGATTADSVTSAATGGMYQFATLASGVTYTISCYAKQTTSGGSFGFYGQGGSFGSTLITPGSTWTRYSFAFTASASGSADNGLNRLVGVDIWGAQLNIGPLQHYYPTTSAAYYGPRFTYDPVTLSALGLLIEEQRTNLLTYSEQVDNAAWVKTGCTITAGAIAAPDGNTTADLVVATGAPGSAYVQTSAPASTSGTATFSVYAKAGTRSAFNMTTFNGSPNTDFNLSTASKTDNNGAVGSITHVGGGWYRCVSTVTLGAPSTQRSFLWSIDGIYLWGAQIEAGAFATSYIPTTTASVTRAADSATMTGANFSSWFNATQGTFVVDVVQTTKITTLSKNWMSANDATLANRFQISSNNVADVNLAVASASASQANITGANLAAGSHKIAARYAVNDFALVVDGTVSGTDVSGVVSSGVNQLNIGTRDGAQDPINNCIYRLRYYNTALTNAQLQALTT